MGYDQPVPEYRHGDTIHLALYWQGSESDRTPDSEALEVGLVDASQRNCAGETPRTRVSVRLPTGTVRGTLVRQQVNLALTPDLPPGRYTFWLRPSTGHEALCLGAFSLRPWPGANLSAAEIAYDHPLEVDFRGGVRLMGYDLDAGAAAPGETIVLTLYWQAHEPIEARYKVFTHVLGEVYNADAGSFLWGQQDNEPVNGTRPTSTWRTGEVIVDRYAIALDARAPSGAYAIEVGLYDPATLERLPVLDRQGQVVADHLIVTHIEIE
jgi:hypothetical protein